MLENGLRRLQENAQGVLPGRSELSAEVVDGLRIGQMAKEGGDPDIFGRMALGRGKAVSLGDGPEPTIGGVVETFEQSGHG
jgi:hypothetical protein